MKNISTILNRLKKSGVGGIDQITTLEEGLDILVNNVILVGGKEAVSLFKRYAVYNSAYILEKHPSFYPLIEKEVDKRQDSQKVRVQKFGGLSTEEAEAEVEKQKILESLGENRIIGYARVSTKEQNLDRQIKALSGAGCQYIFQEKRTGKNVDRIEFKSMMSHLKAGDTVIISELTRLARSTTDLFNIMAEFEAKGVAVKSLKESWLDTTTAHGKLMFTIMSGISQFEREMMLERQAEGIEVAKENGVKFGRKLDVKADIELAVALYKEGKYTTTQIAEMTNISRTTLWRNLKKLGILE